MIISPYGIGCFWCGGFSPLTTSMLATAFHVGQELVISIIARIAQKRHSGLTPSAIPFWESAMTYYQLDSEKLEPGDVILEAGGGLISNAIKLVDGGALNAFSHVFVYVGMNLIMEADEDVRSILASRVITQTPDSYLVLRHPDFARAISHPVWKSFMGNLAFLAMHPEVNKPYNWRGMFATQLRFLGSSSNGFFCSQLVAEAYKRVGVAPFKSDVPPNR